MELASPRLPQTGASARLSATRRQQPPMTVGDVSHGCASFQRGMNRAAPRVSWCLVLAHLHSVTVVGHGRATYANGPTPCPCRGKACARAGPADPVLVTPIGQTQ